MAAHELPPIDVRQVPALAALVEEVRVTRMPRRIIRDNEDVAILMPAAPAKQHRRRRITDADREAAAATFGSLKGQIDPDVFKRERREMQIDEKPPVRFP